MKCTILKCLLDYVDGHISQVVVLARFPDGSEMCLLADRRKMLGYFSIPQKAIVDDYLFQSVVRSGRKVEPSVYFHLNAPKVY